MKVQDLLFAVKASGDRGNVIRVVLSGDALSSLETLRALRSSLEALLGQDVWVDQNDPAIAASVGAGRFANQHRLTWCEGTCQVTWDEL